MLTTKEMLRTGPAAAMGRGLPLWLPLIVLAAAPLRMTKDRFGAIGDPDTFWHLLAGQHLWATHSFAGPDPLSSFTSHEWVLHEWLPELLMAGAYHWLGLPGVAWLALAGYLAVFVVLYRACRQRAGVLSAGVAAVAGWLGVSASLAPRPQVVTFILLTVTFAAWHRTSQDGRIRWWLVLVAWVWACSHGMWFVGPLLGLAMIAGLWLDRSVTARRAGRLALVPLLSVVAAALTPVGPKLLLAPLTVSGYTKFVIEWDPPNVRDPYVLATVAMLAIVAVGWARSSAKVPWTDVMVWAMSLGWMLLYARTVAVAAVLVAPLAAGGLQRAVQREPETATRREWGFIGGGVALALALAAVLAPRVAGETAQMPTALDSQLDAMAPGTVVFNDYTVGGWLLWHHKELRPVIDPRTELYDVGYLTRYNRARGSAPEWRSFISETKATAALVDRDSPLGQSLQDVLRWRVVGRGDGFLLLKAP